MERMAEEYTQELYSMPEGALDGLMRCAIVALGLQERYSVVAACKFVERDMWRASFSILIAIISARNIPSDMHQGCAFAKSCSRVSRTDVLCPGIAGGH